MIKFVIIEDDDDYLETFKMLVNNVMFKTEEPYEIKCYKQYGNDVYHEINDMDIKKVYILDIELGNNSKTGMEIAQMIRVNDWDSEIIFITDHDQMFEMVYRNIFKIFNFIEKFYNMRGRLTNDLTKIVNKNYDMEKFFYSSNCTDLQIYLKDILYIERDTYERKLIIKTKNNSFKVSLTMEQMLASLDKRFKQVHRACIVNTNEVLSYYWGQGYFILKNGTEVPLCSRNYKDH